MAFYSEHFIHICFTSKSEEEIMNSRKNTSSENFITKFKISKAIAVPSVRIDSRISNVVATIILPTIKTSFSQFSVSAEHEEQCCIGGWLKLLLVASLSEPVPLENRYR